ncbi:MAG: hypothetical protein LC130_14040, partial [Bryobacterales bacterium]|nr:hypothetical protein [Bryobacterales bacterium]
GFRRESVIDLDKNPHLTATATSFQAGPARDRLVSPAVSLPIRTPGRFLLHFSRQQVGLLGCYTDSRNPAKLRPSHRISRFTLANGRAGGTGYFSLQPVGMKDVRVCERRVRVRQPEPG